MQSPDPVVDALRQLAIDTFPTDDPATIHIRAGALFARLKALNRDANAAARAHKQITADARHDMDQTHLRLQNLLYEKRHLEREIDKCRQFAYVPLIPIGSFGSCSPIRYTTSTRPAPCTRTYRCIQSNNLQSSLRQRPTRKMSYQMSIS
jgi:Fms-interacting protein/Thoc5